MKTYIMWYNDSKSGAIMEITKVISDCERLASTLPRAMIVSAIMEMMNADEVITADSEEQMLEMFDNAVFIRKEEMH